MPRAKWKQVLELVLRELADGTLAHGAQFYTLEQLCARYHVSDITGRRVFSELKARGLIASKGRRGTTVIGQAVTQDVFMCLPNIYFENGSSGVSRYHSFQRLFEGFGSDNYAQLFRVLPIPLAFLQENLATFADKHVIISAEALVDFTQQPSVLNTALIAQLRDSVNPIVFDSYGDIPGITQVGVHFALGIRKAVSHLVRRGHTRIGLFTGDVNDFWLQPRFTGFVEGMFAEGMRFDPSLLLMTTDLEREKNIPAIHEYLSRPQRPTAIVCTSDSRALFVLEYCRARGIAIPDALAVTGFDNIPEASLVWAPLTTVDGMEVQIGRKTLELLVARRQDKLKEPCEVTIEPELITRVSG